MCGIFSVFNRPGLKIDLKACRLATEMQSHRGPDSSGEWVSDSVEVFLGHRRLSIIDLSADSGQPMISDRGRVLIYNGEIYNYHSIRNELLSTGARFRSSGDTEVLLKAVEEWGAEALGKLEGMFAFVLWNPEDEEAFIARDFFGIKPLYYWQPPNGGLVVSSEIKSFYALPEFQPELDRSALPEFLRFRSLCNGRTLLRGVAQVMPGEFLRYRRQTGVLRTVRYWDAAAFLHDTEALSRGHNNFPRAFRETVQRHLIADVPVGMQFSGGVDSSLISALCVRDLHTRLKGFHCQVTEPDHDESPFAEEMARFLDVELQKVQLTEDVFFSDLLDRLTWNQDEPLSHPNSIGIFLVSQLARGQVKVLLSGEAADEFFGGYSRYPLLLIQSFLRKRPGLLKVAGWISGLANIGDARISALRRAVQRTTAVGIDQLIVEGLDYIELPDLVDLLEDAGAEAKSVEHRWSILDRSRSNHILTRCQIFDIHTYLPPILMRQDKMSMAASIENRVPFVTPRMFSVAMSLPPSKRASPISRKGFLKSQLAGYVPSRLVSRQKWGFGIPLNKWLSQHGGRERLESMTDATSPLVGSMSMKKISALTSGFDGSREKAKALWTLLSLKVWMDIFCNRKSPMDFHQAAQGFRAGAST